MSNELLVRSIAKSLNRDKAQLKILKCIMGDHTKMPLETKITSHITKLESSIKGLTKAFTKEAGKTYG